MRRADWGARHGPAGHLNWAQYTPLLPGESYPEIAPAQRGGALSISGISEIRPLYFSGPG